jgi:hypothetical protein
VLLSGQNPLLANGAGGNAIQDMSPVEVTPDSASMSGESMADAADGRNARARPNQNPGGRRAALQGRGFANLPQLTGLAQIVGLAIGSPEFQRR